MHTYSGNQTEGKFLFHFIPEDLDLVLFDFPGCGNSKAKFVTYGFKEKHDFHNILTKIDQEFGYDEYYLWGRSFGAVVAILYAQSFLSPKLFRHSKSPKRKNKLSKI